MALKEMSTVLDAEREALELENIPEYLSDSSLPSREAAVSMSSKMFTERDHKEQPEGPAHKADQHIETLWPGVDHEFVPQARKSPSFYLCIGFMAGAVISIAGVFGYATISPMVAHAPSNNKHISVVADNFKSPTTPATATTAAMHHDAGGGEVLVPAAPQVQVQTGDTLAAIALRNYKRVSPRLLDEICKTNNLRNANVLSLGQKLNLPEYHSQTTQVAGAGQVQ